MKSYIQCAFLYEKRQGRCSGHGTVGQSQIFICFWMFLCFWLRQGHKMTAFEPISASLLHYFLIPFSNWSQSQSYLLCGLQLENMPWLFSLYTYEQFMQIYLLLTRQNFPSYLTHRSTWIHHSFKFYLSLLYPILNLLANRRS